MTRLRNAGQYKHASLETIKATAESIVQREVEKSHILNPPVVIANESDSAETRPKAQLSEFNVEQLLLGRVLGRGGFCVVRELLQGPPSSEGLGSDDDARSSGSKFNLRIARWRSKSSGAHSTGEIGSEQQTDTKSLKSQDKSSSDRQLQQRTGKVAFSKSKCRRVVKQVETSLWQENRPAYLQAWVDVAIEARFLHYITHPHVVRIHGICRPDNEPPRLVLETLPYTLSQQLNAWMHTHRTTQGITGLVTRGQGKAHALLIERLQVAYDVATVMDFLHGQNIIYRDVKPDNIGFDHNHQLKLFDFGLAKVLQKEDADEQGMYHLTGLTGGIRYMAPEVGLQKPYNLLADVYSWSMLLWYLLALEPPMGLYTPRMFLERVFEKGTRPAVHEKWSPTLGALMRQCWSGEISERPMFKDVMQSLQAEISQLQRAKPGKA